MIHRRHLSFSVIMLLLAGPWAVAESTRAEPKVCEGVDAVSAAVVRVLLADSVTEVRIAGLGWLEFGHPYFEEARSTLSSLMANRRFTLMERGREGSRIVGDLVDGGTDAASVAIYLGLTWNDPSSRSDPYLDHLQSRAMNRLKGLWSTGVAPVMWALYTDYTSGSLETSNLLAPMRLLAIRPNGPRIRDSFSLENLLIREEVQVLRERARAAASELPREDRVARADPSPQQREAARSLGLLAACRTEIAAREAAGASAGEAAPVAWVQRVQTGPTRIVTDSWRATTRPVEIELTLAFSPVCASGGEYTWEISYVTAGTVESARGHGRWMPGEQTHRILRGTDGRVVRQILRADIFEARCLE